MGRVLAIINQKGGTGKTTTVFTIGAGLANAGHSVCLVDLDGQCNLSGTARADPSLATIMDVMRGSIPAARAVQHVDNMDIIPGDPGASVADVEFAQLDGREYLLRRALAPLVEKYDWLVLDCPPTLGIMSINGLVASDRAIIPVQASPYSVQAVGEIVRTINTVVQFSNPDLRILGILLTMFNPRAVAARNVHTALRQMALSIGTRVFTATIRQSTVVIESQLVRQSLFQYAPRAAVTADYLNLVQEILKMEESDNGQ